MKRKVKEKERLKLDQDKTTFLLPLFGSFLFYIVYCMYNSFIYELLLSEEEEELENHSLMDEIPLSR